MRGLVFVLVLALAGAARAQGIITTVAGNANGTPGFSGDGGSAVNALLKTPQGVAVDASGNVYIADSFNYRVRRVSPDGIITTVAGNGATVLFGDGGPATTAGVFPYDVAVDSRGNLYIADQLNQRVRKVDTAGAITTVAGGGSGGLGDGGPAVSAQLREPLGVAVDSAGNIYIADVWSDSRVRKVNALGGITTVAGGGSAFPGDGGPATGARLDTPVRVAIDAQGNLYIAEKFRAQIRMVNASGIITTVAGNGTAGFSGDGGPATRAALNQPYGIAVDSNGNLYVADLGNNRVRRVDASGIITTVAGNGVSGTSGDGGPATNAQLASPEAVAVDGQGSLYVADGSNRVRKVTGAAGSAAPAVGGVVNGASYTAPVSPGAIASLFGSNLATSTVVAASPLPTALAGVTVKINGLAAPLYFVSPAQINFQVPWELLGQAQGSVTVTLNAATSSTQTVNLAPSPGLFSVNSQGTGQGAILVANSDFVAAPEGSVPGRTTRPAKRGEFVSIFCSGLGDVTNRPASGAPPSSGVLSTTTVTPIVSIGGVPAMVVFSGLAPGFVGLYQVNVQVPDTTPSTNAVLVALTIGGIASNPVTIAVQ
jgi:uncharacterized protein (TIGR03437 family)